MVGDEPLQDVDALAPGVEREAAGFRIVFPDGGTRLHVVCDRPRIDDLDPGRVGGRLECGVRFLLVADMSIVGHIAGRAGKDHRRAGLDGFFHVDDGGKLFPRDADQFGGVARLRRRIGDSHRDDVADMMDLVCRHHRIGLERRVRPVGVGDRSDAGERAEFGEIARDIYGADARRGARGLDVLDAEFRMPIGTAQKHRPEFGALDRVRGEIAAAADQANVLNALDALPYPNFVGFISSPFPRAAR